MCMKEITRSNLLAGAVFVYVMISGQYLVSGTPCADHGNKYNIPVLRFCTDDEVSSENIVIMDGYYANTLNNERYCTCTARALYSTVSKLQYEGLLYPSSFENNTACGSKVLFKQLSYMQKAMYCQSGGYLPITDGMKNITVTITLIKEHHPRDTRYCFNLTFDYANLMVIKCNNANEDNTMTSDIYDTEITSQLYTERTILEKQTTDTVFASKTSISDTSRTDPGSVTGINSSKADNAKTIHKNEKDDSKNVYVAIGCGTGGLLLIAGAVAICLIEKLRRRNRQNNRDNNEPTGDIDDDFDLQYNTLYVSNDDNCVQHIVNNQQETDITENQVEGNCREIYLNTKPKYDANNRKYDVNMEGDYAAIVTEGMGSAYQSNATESGSIAALESTSSSRENAELCSVRQVIAFKEDRCEYAVVENPNSDKCNEVYAVVDKTRKKKS